VTIEDPTVWTRPWAVKQEFTKQSDQENRVNYEPRCVEGNYALPGWLRGRRMEEYAFAEGLGPDPATKDYTGAIVNTGLKPLKIRCSNKLRQNEIGIFGVPGALSGARVARHVRHASRLVASSYAPCGGYSASRPNPSSCSCPSAGRPWCVS
jgi:hypothetical protein